MSQRTGQTAHSNQNQSGDEPSIGELISILARDTQTLVKQEVTLAKTELNQSVKQLVSSIVKVVIGGLILYAGLIVLLFAAVGFVHRLDFSWPVSALIVGGITLLVGLILVLIARSGMSGSNLMPTETIDSLKDDRDWAKGQAR